MSSPRPTRALFSPGPNHPKGLTMAMVNNSLDEIDLAALKVSFVPSFSSEPRKCCFCAGSRRDLRSHGGCGKWYLRTGFEKSHQSALTQYFLDASYFQSSQSSSPPCLPKTQTTENLCTKEPKFQPNATPSVHTHSRCTVILYLNLNSCSDPSVEIYFLDT